MDGIFYLALARLDNKEAIKWVERMILNSDAVKDHRIPFPFTEWKSEWVRFDTEAIQDIFRVYSVKFGASGKYDFTEGVDDQLSNHWISMCTCTVVNGFTFAFRTERLHV